MLQWIDTHLHLDHPYPFTTEEYIQNAKSNGVSTLITISAEPASLQKAFEFSQKYENVFFTVGIHPHEAKFLNAEIKQLIQKLQTDPKCVAVGEIGLDYHYNHSTPEIQQEALIAQLHWAAEWKKPIVIHSRDAEEALLEHLKNHYIQKCSLKDAPGVIHCFSGTKNFANACLDLGFYISFSGILTFKKTEALREIAKQTPLNRILIETDAPYLAPVPYRGKPNQSAYMIEVAKMLSEIRGISLETLSQATVENSKKVFNLPASS